MSVIPITIKVSKHEINDFKQKYKIEKEAIRISCNPSEQIWIDTKIGYNHEENRIYIDGFHFVKKIALYFLEHINQKGGRFYFYPQKGEARLPENQDNILIAKLIYVD